MRGGREGRCMVVERAVGEKIYMYTFWWMAVAIDLLQHVIACNSLFTKTSFTFWWMIVFYLHSIIAHSMIDKCQLN